MRFGVCVVFVLLLSLQAHADEETVLPPITVYGEQEVFKKDPSLSGRHIKVSDSAEGSVTLPEILSSQAGVHINRYGGLEDFTSVSIRGSSAEEVTILLDGIPLNSAQSGQADLSLLFLEYLDSIDIYRGGSPLDYGLTPSAGTIALNTGKPAKGMKMGGSLGYGSFNTIKNHLFFSFGKNNWGIQTAFSMVRTNGDFTFLDDNGTPANSDDDARVARQNNASQTLYPFVKIFYEFDKKTRLELGNHFIRKDSGIPGLSTNQSETAALDTTSWLSSLKLKRSSLFHKNLEGELQTYWRLTKTQYSDPQGEIGLGGAQDNDNDTSLFGQQFLVKWRPHPQHTFTGVSLFQTERFRPEDFLANPSRGGTSVRHTWNVGVGDEIGLLHDRLILSPHLLLSNIYNQINNNDPSFLTPATFADNQDHHVVSTKMGAKGRITSFLSMTGNVGRGYRFPTFAELFGDRGGVVGNQLLDPEKSLNWDVGVDVSLVGARLPRPSFTGGATPPLHFNTTYFEHRTTDLIQFEQNAGFARAENVGSARVRGVEVEVHGVIGSLLSVSTNYTFQNPIDQTSGRNLVGRPEHEVDVRVDGKVPFLRSHQPTLFVSANWMDSFFLDPLNTRVVRSRLLLNSGFLFNPLKHWTFSFEGKNLTNNQIVDVVGFPLPGRSFFGKVTYEL